MAMRIVAIVIVAGLGLFVWSTKHEAENPVVPPKVDQTAQYTDPNVEGVEPDGPPDFNVGVELRMQGEKGILDFTITEAHGWYAEFLYIDFWYVAIDENGEERQIGDPVTYMCHHFLPFGETLEEYTSLLDLEFKELDGWGTTENWRAMVSKHGKVLAPETAD